MSTQASDLEKVDRRPDRRLSGWKEISAHLGRGVRTAQRWEKALGMPVHRIGREREIVFAFGDELDAWLARERLSGSLDSAADDDETPRRDAVNESQSDPADRSLAPATKTPRLRRGRWLLIVAVLALGGVTAALWLPRPSASRGS